MCRLALNNVTIHAGGKGLSPIIHDVNLRMAAGEILGLLGPNGCGKTSLIRAIAGFIPTDNSKGVISKHWRVHWGNELRRMTGEILIEGHDVTNFAPGERGVALVPQNLALYPDKTVIENLAFPLKARGIKKKESYTRATVMSKWVGISDILNKRPSEISGGQQQRVAIGRALIAEPRLVLLDEPLASLDTLSKSEILSFISKTLRERGASAIYVTHDPTEATTLCDHVAFINNHRIQQVASPRTAYNAPETLFVARMFSGFVSAVKGQIGNDGLFTPAGCTSQWDLKKEFVIERQIIDQTKWIAGRASAFNITSSSGQGVEGKLIGRFTLNGSTYARVEIAKDVFLVCRDTESAELNSNVTVTLAEHYGDDLLVFDQDEKAININRKPSQRRQLISA